MKLAENRANAAKKILKNTYLPCLLDYIYITKTID